MANLSLLEEFCTGDDTLLAQVIQAYLESSREDLDLLVMALETHNGDTIREKAHKLKGFALMMQAEELVALLDPFDREMLERENKPIPLKEIQSITAAWEKAEGVLLHRLHQLMP